jgi:hypothetical protein
MKTFDFYFFKDLVHKQQPYLSNWCWAACLSSIIDGLVTTTSIGNKQCNLASFYKRYRKNNNINVNYYDDCCPQLHNTSNECNKGIQDTHIEDVYKHSGLLATPYDNKLIKSYTWVKDILKEKQAPILVKYRENGQAHASLIIGYGEINSCRYLLLSDPNNSTAEEYKLMKMIINLSIEKIWVLEKINNIQLKKDEEIYQRYAKAVQYVESLKSNNINKTLYKELSNPLDYLGYKYPALIDDLFNNINNSINLQHITQNKLVQDFRSQKVDSACQRKIVKKPEDQGNIIGLSLNDLDNPTDEIIEFLKDNKFDCKIYIKEYAIEVNAYLDKGSIYNSAYRQRNSSINQEVDFSFHHYNDNQGVIMLLPIHIPENYNLNRNPQSLEDFKLSLTNLPKAEFFSSEKDSLAPLTV